MALGIVLYTASKYSFMSNKIINSDSIGLYIIILILILWMMPAVLVWLVGTLFEKNFANSYPSKESNNEVSP